MNKFAYALVGSVLAVGSTALLADTGVIIHQKNGSNTFFPASEVEYVEFIDENSSVTPPDDSNEITSSIKDLKVGDQLSATAVVTAIDTRGFVLTDNAGSVLYYNPSVNLATYPLGTVVKVNGTVSVYNRGFQLTDNASLSVVGNSNVEYPQPTVYTGAMVDAACNGTDNFQASYVQIEGKLSVSGNYSNIIIDGANNQGSLYYVTDDLKNQITNGQSYKFNGYFIGVSGSTTKYFNLVLTSVSQAGSTTPGGGSDNADEVPAEYTYPLSYVKLPEGTPQQVKEYTGFTVNYNKNNHTPNYVAWELLSSETDGSTAVSRNYWVDNDIIGCAPKDDGWASAGFDRGHMCPAADQKWSSQAMKDCAVMANMVPQPNSFNGGKWATLEDKERSNANKYGKIWIICGPLYTDMDTKYIGSAQTRVPGACFKVFLYEDGANSKGIAYVMNNDNTNTGDLQNYAMSIDDLEEITGFDFFPALPDNIENAVESTFNTSLWN